MGWGGLFNYSHVEKLELVERCYEEGGMPYVDSSDSAGLNGTTDGVEASRAGSYNFECKDD